MEGRIKAICISRKKGTIKHEVEEAILIAEHGIEGDAHAGPGQRQVSLLADESIRRMKELLPQLANGAFAENLVTSGLPLRDLRIGEFLVLAEDVVLKVTRIGKDCHNHGCAIRKATGSCIMPVEGVFTQVIKGGLVKKGSGIRVQPQPPPRPEDLDAVQVDHSGQRT